MELPKVLVVGINPWVDNTGINTLINFFECWDKDKLAHIYTRDGLPCTHICDRFFRISEPKVLRSVLKRRTKTGEVVLNTERDEKSIKSSIYSGKNSALKQLCREMVWKVGKWKTKELDTFLSDFAPDVLFFPVYSNVYMCRLQNYIARKTGKPVILYSSDDNYSYKCIEKTPFSILHRFWLRRQEKRLIKRAERVMVISPKQKEEYDRLFGVDSVILTKGVDFSLYPFLEKKLSEPIKMVYTGKLIIGRWRSLAAIAEALGEINRDKTRIELDIYTTDRLTEEQDRLLNRNGASVKGSLTLSEVQMVQSEADILVFVESLEKKHRNAARLSFSTKITDYLKSGRCIFAIGDEDIAPIDYFRRYDSAICATSYGEIADNLFAVAENPALVAEYAHKAYECGRDHHEKSRIDEILKTTIKEAKKDN